VRKKALEKKQRNWKMGGIKEGGERGKLQPEVERVPDGLYQELTLQKEKRG